MDFIGAHNFTLGRTRQPPNLIVIHTMEARLRPGAARDTAKWAAGPNAPQASWHVGVDADDTIRSVADGDTAWHAPGVNARALGVEQATRATTKRETWLAGDHRRMLLRTAAVVGDWSRAYGIPLRKLAPGEVKAGAAGVCGHIDVTRAGWGTHTDPDYGSGNYPYDVLLSLASGATTPEDDLTKEEHDALADAQTQAANAASGVRQLLDAIPKMQTEMKRQTDLLQQIANKP